MHELENCQCCTEGNKHIYILDKLFDCIQPHQHFLLKDNETNFIVYKFNNSFSENKFSFIEKFKNKTFSLFKHQITHRPQS